MNCNLVNRKALLCSIVLLAVMLLVSGSAKAQIVEQSYYYDVDNAYEYITTKVVNNVDNSDILNAMDKYYNNVNKYYLHSLVNTESEAALMSIVRKKGFGQAVRVSTDTNLTTLGYAARYMSESGNWVINTFIGGGIDRTNNTETLFGSVSIGF